MADIILEGTLSAITTHTAARLVCGASSKEFPDASFSDAELAEDLELDLNRWLGEASLSYVTIITQGTAASPTAAERADYLNLKKYSKYYLAIQVVKTMSLGMPEQITDGQNAMKRFFTDPDDLIDRLQATAEGAKNDLLDAHDQLPEVTSPLVGAGNVYDPVTDESE